MPEPQPPPKQAPPGYAPPPPPNAPAPGVVHPVARPPTPASSPDSRDLRIVGRTLGLLIVLVAIALSLYVTRLYYVYPRTDDAYVRANVVGIAAHVSGPIVEMPIADNQHVKQGQLLFVVDPRPYQSAVDQAEAELALTDLQIKALDDAIRSARSREAATSRPSSHTTNSISIASSRCCTRHFVTANDVFNARSRVEADEAGVASAHSDVSQGAE